MGFRLLENFRQPYFATNPSDFWRRWHISLSTWLRDYLYIPLGGNRHGPLRTYLALTVTMLLGGLWHGASWTFVLWGAYHGILLVVHRLIQSRKRSPLHQYSKSVGVILHVLKVAIFFQFTCIGWLIFRAQGGSALKDHVAHIFQTENWFNISEVNMRLILALGIVTIALDLWAVLLPRARAQGMPIWALGAGWTLIAVCIVVLAPTSIGSFIYFQF